MSEYYLISQLPSLDAVSENVPLPITEERFFELCESFLGKKAQTEMKSLTLLPSRESEPSGSALVNSWNENERRLRFALGRVRAERMKKTFDTQNTAVCPEQNKVAAAAVEMDDPMEAEVYLNRYRLNYLESIRPIDSFSTEYIYYYGLKLKLLLRMREFDAKAGKTAYRNIYDFILNGEKLEAKQ